MVIAKLLLRDMIRSYANSFSDKNEGNVRMKGRPLFVSGVLAALPLFAGCGESSSPASPEVDAVAKGGNRVQNSTGAVVKSNVGIPGHFSMEAESGDCYNSTGPWITLRGELSLGGLSGKLIFRNNRQGTHEAEEDVTASVVLLEKGETIRFEKQPSLGGVGGNPWILMELLDGRGRAVSDEFLLGRCVQGLMTNDLDFVMEGLAQAEVTSADCNNSGGPMITVDGDLRLGGLSCNLIFRNNRRGTHERYEESEVSIVIVPEDSEINIPKPPAFGGATGNPHIFFVFTDGDGEPISGEFYLGRCVQMSQ